MIEFILGEDRHIRFRVCSCKRQRVVVESASFEISSKGEPIEKGACEIITEDEAVYLDIKFAPPAKGSYLIEVTYLIADETLRHKEYMMVG